MMNKNHPLFARMRTLIALDENTPESVVVEDFLAEVHEDPALERLLLEYVAKEYLARALGVTPEEVMRRLAAEQE